MLSAFLLNKYACGALMVSPKGRQTSKVHELMRKMIVVTVISALGRVSFTAILMQSVSDVLL